MAATTTITSFDGSDTVGASAAVATLAPEATDVIITYTLGNKVFIIKQTP